MAEPPAAQPHAGKPGATTTTGALPDAAHAARPHPTEPGTAAVGAELIKGASIAATIREQIKAALAAQPSAAGGPTALRSAAPRPAAHRVVPCLVNVVVGEEPASQSYLDTIDGAAAKLGITSRRITLRADCGEDALIAALAQAGADPSVHGLMLQTPLPRGMSLLRAAAAIPPAKDVDGLSLASLGAVLAGERRHTAPCTAAAVIEILCSDARLSPAGKDVVVIGRSLVVGRPLAAMLCAPLPSGQATVTLCHTRTADLAAHTRRADIVVVAAGVAGLLQPGHVRPGAIVVDVGTHPVQRDGIATLAGDADPAVAGVAAFLTPVPGGVGPVTNAVLMRHVTAAALPGYLPPAW